MSYDLSFDKRSAALLAVCTAVIAGLLVAAGFLIGIRKTISPLPSTPSLATPDTNRAATSPDAPVPSTPKPPTLPVAPAGASTAPVATDGPASRPAAEPPTEAAFTLQFGAFKDQANAQAKAKELKEKGVIATIVALQDIAGRTFYTVRSGSYRNASDAAAAARDLQRSTQEQVIVRSSQHF